MDGGRVCESVGLGVQKFRSLGVQEFRSLEVYERERNARSGNGI